MLTMKRLGAAGLVFLVSACGGVDSTAPLTRAATSASVAGEKGPDFVAVCHAMPDGSYRRIELPSAAANVRLGLGDELAGGPKLDANCERYKPMVFRDDFDGPLGPNWYFLKLSSTVQNGTLQISGQGWFNVRSNFYAPFPVSRIVWELGWRSEGTAGLLSRNSSGCAILCNYEVYEEFFSEAFGVRYRWDPYSPFMVQSRQLTNGDHVARVVWDRILGRATYTVDGVLLAEIPTRPRFVHDYGVLDFSLWGTVTLTHFQYEIHPEF